MKRLVLLVGGVVLLVAWHPGDGHSAPRQKTKCIGTGNVFYFKVCSKKPHKCWMNIGLQFFMYNWEPQRMRFTFHCTVRYGRKLRKKKTETEVVYLKRGVNCLGGAVFTWPGIEKDWAKRRYKYRCTCSVSSLLLAYRAKR